MPSPPIFVAIAAYSDPELPRTLHDALAQARWPDRLRFGMRLGQDLVYPRTEMPERDLVVDARPAAQHGQLFVRLVQLLGQAADIGG